jgi:general secretion pathway protein M
MPPMPPTLAPASPQPQATLATPAAPTALASLAAPLAAFWQARNPQEHRWLLGLGLFICLALLADGLWSAHHARQRLRQQIPALEQQLATLQRQAGDLRALQSQPVTLAPPSTALVEQAATVLQAAGLPVAANQLAAEGPRQLRLRATLPFDRWIDATADLQRNAQLRLVQCQVDTVSPGQARIDALFALPEPARPG